MKNKSKILFAASEATPIAKVGGLGDVAGALPKALSSLGADVRLVLPLYGSLDRKKYGVKKLSEKIYGTFLPGSKVRVYLIEDRAFANKEIYGKNDTEKFLRFSQMIFPAMESVGFRPDIIHLNDWHVAAVATEIKKKKLNIKTVFTIHNLANQGISDGRNLMAEGILNSDIITTVSPTYAKEILTPEYGSGMEKLLARRKKDLFGILNGIDTDFFNPERDKLISQNYSSQALEKKLGNKLKLQKKLKLPVDKNTALVGMVTRLVGQKGLELFNRELSRLNCQFVILGTGEKRLEKSLSELSRKYPDKFKVIIKFDEKLAHEIYAASDLFLVPSKFEPCGLTQLVAMRYGSVPIVRATGGLADTVDEKVGFTFKNFLARDFRSALSSALKIYYEQPKIFRQLQLNGMSRDYSWKKSALKYIELYGKLTDKK